MTATVERPPDAPQARPAPPNDVPWPSRAPEENPATITSTVAGIFAAFGLIAVLLLGLMLGGRFKMPAPGARSEAGGNAALSLDVTATEFKFAPAQLTMGGPGQLTINLMNHGAVEHDLTIDGVKGKAYAKAGGSAKNVFQIAKAGTYEFFCSIPGHKEAGMKGTLVVGGAAASAGAVQPAAGAPAAAAAPQVAPAVAGVKPLPLPEVAPPVNRTAPTLVKYEIETKEVTAQLADGTTYNYWTFNGTVPGPMLRVRVGDDVEITLKNPADSKLTHSIDLHAVTGPGGGAKVTQVPAGGSATFRFKALNPGVYVYHCATPMVAHHIASGMYGLIVVEPEGGFTKVDREYYVMQGDFYLSGDRGQAGHHEIGMADMMNENPDYVLFNGSVGALTGQNALKATVGETVRFFFGVGGPNLTSSFHVIGEIFDRVYPEGATQAMTNVQTTLVPTGGAAIAEFKVEVPGDYIVVDHSLTRLEKGAAAILTVSGPENPAVFQPITTGNGGSGGH
ncbi:MAG TPA: copper-containing nitrite reductase [Chloroflexota bacterium]|nr:copper-containing nitrite reductase [Chloroflexota bacterium]